MCLDGDGVSDRGIYQGYGVQQVDQKGRVAIPSSLRDTLSANAALSDGQAGTFCLSTHENDRCLIGFDGAYARIRHQALLSRQERILSETGAVDHNLMRTGIGPTEALPLDASGRFVLPDFPRARARIGNFAFFWGAGDTFEIWDPETLVAYPDAPEVMKDAARFLMQKRGVQL